MQRTEISVITSALVCGMERLRLRIFERQSRLWAPFYKASLKLENGPVVGTNGR